jgi:hypothetical protein
MSSTGGASDWIKRIADDERKRDAARLTESAAVARQADLVRVHGRRLIDQLGAAVLRDVESFRREFLDDRTRDVVVDATEPDGGFVVRKLGHPAVSLAINPRLGAGTIACHYRFTMADGMPPRDDRFTLVFSGDGADGLQLKHQGAGRRFATADALSEFLLVPVLTGHPR